MEVYSSTSKQWLDGQIVRIFNDEEGEWLEVQYFTGVITLKKTHKKKTKYIFSQKRNTKGKNI